MGQPTPDLPLDLPHSSNHPRCIPAPALERGGDGGTPSLAPVGGLSCHLRPPPLFRSIGLTGLSASLPPHRRLRSVLRRERAVLPARADGTAEPWSRTRAIGSNGSAIAPEMRPSTKGHPCTSLQPNHRSDAALHGHRDSLPDIVPHKLSVSQTCQGRGWSRESYSVSEAGILIFDGSRSEVDKHTCLRPNSSLTDNFVITPVSTAQRLSGTGYGPPCQTHAGGRKSTVWPLLPSACSSETVVTPGKHRKRQRKKNNSSGACSQSERSLTPEKGGKDNFCQLMDSLRITDREKGHASSNRRGSKEGGSARQKVSNRKGPVFKTEHGDKGVCHTRRDRRPHFLPPITQSECLLNVPLILPENSPPPSPRCESTGPFLPLHVPTLPLCFQGNASASEHTLKRT
ncbi:uncharacterized protein LOC143516294 isoform X2 [Brachyhypopomus gauderio]